MAIELLKQLLSLVSREALGAQDWELRVQKEAACRWSEVGRWQQKAQHEQQDFSVVFEPERSPLRPQLLKTNKQKKSINN